MSVCGDRPIMVKDGQPSAQRHAWEYFPAAPNSAPASPIDRICAASPIRAQISRPRARGIRYSSPVTHVTR
jgi:hypothetical protein